MRPPICEVCGERFDPGDGALVECVGDDRSASFDERLEQPGLVGHPPNLGWFCADHRSTADVLAATHTLAEVVAVARRNDGHRRCDACGIAFMEPTGGQVDFATTADGARWDQDRVNGGAIGDSPDRAWMCNRHLRPAMRLGGHLTKEAAIAELVPDGRPPLEYDEMPASADPDIVLRRGPFLPVADPEFDRIDAHETVVAPHPPRVVREAIRDVVPALFAALGGHASPSGGSRSSASDAPADRRWAPQGTQTSSSVASSQTGEIAVFTVAARHRDDDGTTVAEHARLLAQRRERSIVEIAIGPTDPPTVASDGVRLAGRALTRVVDGLDHTERLALDAVVAELTAGLRREAVDPLDRAPDLSDVDLGSGEIVRSAFGDGSSVKWPLGSRPIARRIDVFLASVEPLLAALGVETGIDLVRSQSRSYTPMDGAGPPDCPFTETVRWEGTDSELAVAVSVEHQAAFWNENDLSNESASLAIRVDGSRRLWLSMHGDSPVVLSLGRPTTAAVVAAVRSHFGR